MDLDILELMSAASFWESVGYIATGVVVIGVAGETVIELTNWIKSRRLRRFVERASALVLLIGLTGEILTQVHANNKNSLIIGLLDGQTVKLKSDNLALEAKIAPRRLAPDQEKSLASLFAKFPGRTVHVSSYMQDVEGALFGEQILRAADDAGLPKDDKRMRVSTFGIVTVGLVVTGTETSFIDSATTLFDSFKLAPVTNHPVQGNFMDVQDEDSPFPLKIFVGAKPLPIDAP